LIYIFDAHVPIVNDTTVFKECIDFPPPVVPVTYINYVYFYLPEE